MPHARPADMKYSRRSVNIRDARAHVKRTHTRTHTMAVDACQQFANTLNKAALWQREFDIVFCVCLCSRGRNPIECALYLLSARRKYLRRSYFGLRSVRARARAL